jgi:hypothetical protein
MSLDRDYNETNAETLAALKALIGQMSDDDLNASLGEGWTVATMLAHLAFYDARAVWLLKQWEAAGAVSDAPLDPDATNAAMLPLAATLPPRAAAALALRMAEEADATVASIKPDLARQVLARPETRVRLHRSHHRSEHLEQIRAALGK